MAPLVCRCDVSTSIAKTIENSTMPTDDRRRLYDHQGIHNVRRNPIERCKHQPIKIAESEPSGRFSPQHIELVAQRQNLRFTPR